MIYLALISGPGFPFRLPDIFYPDPEIRMDGGQHGREFFDNRIVGKNKRSYQPITYQADLFSSDVRS